MALADRELASQVARYQEELRNEIEEADKSCKNCNPRE